MDARVLDAALRVYAAHGKAGFTVALADTTGAASRRGQIIRRQP